MEVTFFLDMQMIHMTNQSNNYLIEIIINVKIIIVYANIETNTEYLHFNRIGNELYEGLSETVAV